MHPLESKTKPAPRAKSFDICIDPACYSAFPQVVRLEGDDLFMAFRQAPRQSVVRHTHPRSIITVARSSDLGRTWDLAENTQLAAGGGQEFCPIYLGGGLVAGSLAYHEVVPERDKERVGFPKPFPIEYPCRTPGTFWLWSDTYGLTWRPDHVVMMSECTAPCGPPIRARDGTILCPIYSFDMDRYEIGMMSSLLQRSRDSGRTWSKPITMAKKRPGVRDYCEPAVVETKPGLIRAYHRVETREPGGRGFWTNESTDGGRTWSDPEPTGILSGACPRPLMLSDGRLLLTFGRRFPPYGIRAMLSEDGGRSWGDTAWILRPTNGGNQGYTSSVELGGGRIFTATYCEDISGTTGIVGIFWHLP